MELTNNGVLGGQPGQAVTPSPVQPVAAPAAQTPASSQTPVQTPEATDQNSPVTRGEVQAMLADLARKNQSQQDKFQNRVEQRIASLQAAGITATSEQVQKMIQAEDSQQPSGVQQNAQQQNIQQPPAQDGQPNVMPNAPVEENPILKKAIDILSAAGIKPDDEEMALLDKGEDPQKFLASVAKAAAARFEKEHNAGNPARMPVLGGGGPSNTPVHANMGASQTLDAYFEGKFK